MSTTPDAKLIAERVLRRVTEWPDRLCWTFSCDAGEGCPDGSWLAVARAYLALLEKYEREDGVVMGLNQQLINTETAREEAESRAAALEAEVARSKEALEVLEDVVNQSCTHGGILDSMATSAYEDALLFLSRIGRVRLLDGSYIRGEWITPTPDTKEADRG